MIPSHMGKQSTRRTDGAFTGDDLASFWLGLWVPVRSSNVVACRYLAEDQLLEVEFRGNSFYSYPQVDEKLAEEWALSPSKGGAIHDLFRVPGRPYTPYTF